MFSNPVVFVIGAGASCEYGMPSGAGLRDQITQAVRFKFESGRLVDSGSPRLFDELRRHFGNNANSYARAGRELANAMASFQSVDEALLYLSAKDEIIQLGKMAIVQLILEAERKSSLFRDGPNARAFDRIESGWLFHFLTMALSGTRKEEAGSLFENVTILNFNYDRVVEHYIYEALQHQAGLSPVAARDSIEQMHVIRPYGSVGALKWQDNKGIPFGEFEAADIGQLAQAIRTFTEDPAGIDVVEEISTALENSKLTAFLGFGFHQQNMKIIQARGPTPNRVFATILGFHEENYDSIRGSIGEAIRAAKRDIKVLNMSAHEMILKLRPSMMAAL